MDCALRAASLDLLPKVARRAGVEGVGQLGVASAAANEVEFDGEVCTGSQGSAYRSTWSGRGILLSAGRGWAGPGGRAAVQRNLGGATNSSKHAVCQRARGPTHRLRTSRTMAPKIKAIIKLLKNDIEAFDILATGNKNQFIDHIRHTTCSGIEGLDSLPDDSLLCGIISACSAEKIPHFMKEAAQSYRHVTRNRRSARLEFISESRLHLHPSLRDAFLAKIPRHIVKALPAPYPPLGHHISESLEIRSKWEDHLANGYQPDSRKARHPIIDLDLAKLTMDIGPDESAILETKSKKLVGLVIRNFCGSEASIPYAEATAAAQMPNRRNVRASFSLCFDCLCYQN